MELIKTEMKAVLPLEWQDFLVFAKPKLVFSRKTPRFVIYPDFATFFIFYKQKNIEKYSLGVGFFYLL